MTYFMRRSAQKRADRDVVRFLNLAVANPRAA